MNTPESRSAKVVNDSSLHATIIAVFLDGQRPPSLGEIAAHLGCDEVTARRGLHALADNHGVVLHPNSDDIWVTHPFSAAPTTCVVRSGAKKWWGNCAWCSLGLARLAGGTSTIETRLGALDEPVTIRIEQGELLDTDLVVHFPIPMRKAWDNVIYTCSVMLFFRDEAQVDDWCRERGIPKGDVQPIERVWKFASEWYSRHADEDWVKWSVPQAAEIFRRHDYLTGPIWSLDGDGKRF